MSTFTFVFFGCVVYNLDPISSGIKYKVQSNMTTTSLKQYAATRLLNKSLKNTIEQYTHKKTAGKDVSLAYVQSDPLTEFARILSFKTYESRIIR